MTRETAKELLPIIQAFADGKTIQIEHKGEWSDISNPDTKFDCNPSFYRIKPEPREWTLAVSKMDESIYGTWDELDNQEREGFYPVRVREIIE